MSPSVLRGASVSGSVHAVAARPAVPPPPPAPDDPAEVLARAHAEADAITGRARADADAAVAAGYAEGHAAGRADGLAEVAASLGAVEGMAAALAARRIAMEDEATEQAALLAVEIAAKLLRAELSIAPERVVDVVRGAIRRASERTAITVLVHPDDLAACREAAGDIMARMGGIGSLEIVDEPRVDRGSCIVRTPNGDVDATFSSQLARVMEALAAPPDDALTDGAHERP